MFTCSSVEVSAVPSVLVMVGGGVNTLKTVLESTKRGIPVVVIAGSGRAADLISEFVTAKVKYGSLNLLPHHPHFFVCLFLITIVPGIFPVAVRKSIFPCRRNIAKLRSH